MYFENDNSADQPKRKPKKKKEMAEEYYRLGRRSASLDQKAKDANQTAELNMVQSMMLQNQKNELLDVIAEVKRQQDQLNRSMAEALGPPPLDVGLPMGELPQGAPPPMDGMPQGGMPPGGMPPPPEPAMAGLPPDFGQQPPPALGPPPIM